MRKTKLWLTAALFSTVILQGVQAQETEQKTRDLGKVVVTGNRFETPIEKSCKVIYKITADQITRSS